MQISNEPKETLLDFSTRPSKPHRRTHSQLFPWVSRLVESCQEGDIETLYEILSDYERYKKAALAVEDLTSLLNLPLNGKWSCIHYAAYENRSRLVKELLDLGADVNSVTNDHWTPLQICCYQGHQETLEVLLAHPLIEVNKMTSERGTALHLASQNGHTLIVKELLKHDPDVTLEDPNGITAVELAGNIEIAEEIPKHVGEQILRRCSLENLEPPLGFNGEVWHTFGSAATEKLVYLSLDAQNGNFNHYRSRDDYINEFPPKYSIPFEAINGVKVSSEVYDGKHFFLITGPDIRLTYYTGFQDMTQEWTKRILDFIRFFRVPENKMRKMNPTPPPVPEQDTHLHCFEIIEELGFGSYGKVFKVKKKGTEELYALKSLNQTFLRQKKQLKYAIAECRIMKSIKHPFVLPMFWSFQTDSHLFLVLEYCPNGDMSMLLSYVHHLTISQARFYIAEIVAALDYLHSKNIIYRDLKPHNTLIDAHGHVRLADFGLAKENTTQVNPSMSFCGSPAYLAPEVLKRLGAWKAIDSYSVGVNLYEYIVGTPPFYDDDIEVLYSNILQGNLKFPPGFDEVAQNLIENLLCLDPDKRLPMPEIKKHEFFAEIDWIELENKTVSPPFPSQFLKGVKRTKNPS
jgi:tRNA A-37 threonylcarbamoyl transferase component Bud32